MADVLRMMIEQPIPANQRNAVQALKELGISSADATKELFVFDEFTSVVDRNVAKIGSLAMQKAIRQSDNKKQFIAVTCHFDVIEWLQPDWIFSTNDMTFSLSSKKPNITLSIYEIQTAQDKRKYWKMFSKYHYLSDSFNIAAKVFICFANDNLCGFCAALPSPLPKIKNVYREHRTVVLPDFQDVGIGHKFSNWVAEYFIKHGKRYISTTSNPALIHARCKDAKWVMKEMPKRKSKPSKSSVFN